MEYFKNLQQLLKIEQEADRKEYRALIERSSLNERRESGLTWYPIAIRDTEIGRADYLTVELERTAHQDEPHLFRFGSSAAIFSNHNPNEDKIEGIISFQSANTMKITFRTDELPEWSRNGKLGVNLLFDEVSYDEMSSALSSADKIAGTREEPALIKILTGRKTPDFDESPTAIIPGYLNQSQQEAVRKIITANELAIVHGPPGTGKTTTLVQAVKTIIQQHPQQVLVTAPSNTAVDLLSEKLSAEGLNVLRIGNPVRVSDHLMSLTLDAKTSAHSVMKEVKKMKKRAAEFLDMAHKYKRHFGKAERDQRKALFDEARQIRREAEKTEDYITQDIISQAQVITATLVGSNHYTIKNRRYQTIVIDEAGQAIEPACWIPILKGEKLILAGDHFQLPPTIKSDEAAREGLAVTLLQKCVGQYPESVVMLREQYRMNKMIMGYSSAIFYENKLIANHTVSEHTLFPNDQPLYFIDTAGCGFYEQLEGTNISNPEEASFLIKQLALLAERLSSYFEQENFPSIGIISPYRKQVELLKELFEHSSQLQVHKDKISINTIDSFQGQERDIIYISLTRSNPECKIGFLADIRRMNVAITRARKKLVMIGDSATLSSLAFYKELISYAEEHDGWKSAWEYMI